MLSNLFHISEKILLVSTIDDNTSVFLMYTNGYTGMIENENTGLFEIFDFMHLTKHLPSLPC